MENGGAVPPSGRCAYSQTNPNAILNSDTLSDCDCHSYSDANAYAYTDKNIHAYKDPNACHPDFIYCYSIANLLLAQSGGS